MESPPHNPEQADRDHSQATLLLRRIQDGESDAVAELLPLVYDQLRAMAGGYFRGQRPDHTLQPTALVHEAYLKLARSGGNWECRAHFCAVAARAMRQILLNHRRARRAAKRQGHRVNITVDHLPRDRAQVLDLVELSDALDRLEAINDRYARILEMRFFAGATVDEIAHALGLSRSTVESDWRGIRAWLHREFE